MATSLKSITENIAFLGGGNMATALIASFVDNGLNPSNICVLDRNSFKRDNLHTRYKINTVDKLALAIDKVDIVILAVKPNQAKEITTSLAKELSKSSAPPPLFISIAAGINSALLASWLEPNTSPAIIRCMPNTPAVCRQGATGLFANKHVSEVQREAVKRLLDAVGISIWLEDEGHLDIVTGLSGSGPAYFIKICEALIHSSHKLGLPVDTAKLLTLQTMKGAAIMAMESDNDLATLRTNVTSKGGTTHAGLTELENGNIDALISDALNAATLRAKELQKENQD